MRTRYRIVRDNYLGYEAQCRPWWSPFWYQMRGRDGISNTHKSIEDAESFIRQRAVSRFVKYVEVEP